LLFWELFNQKLYIIYSSFEFSFYLGGSALAKTVAENATYAGIEKKKKLFQFLKLNKFCLMGK